MTTIEYIVATVILFLGGTIAAIISYFLRSTMDELRATKQLAQDTKGELDVLRNDHDNKDKFLNDKFDRLNSSLDKLTIKIEELTAKIK